MRPSEARTSAIRPAYLRERLLGKTVDIEVRDVDQYGRLVARLSLGGNDVGLDVLRTGHGWHYVRYSDDPLHAAVTCLTSSDQRLLEDGVP